MTTSLRRSSSDSAISPTPLRALFSDARSLLRRLRRQPHSPHHHHSDYQTNSSSRTPSCHDHTSSSYLQLPYARRNLELKFWQVDSDGIFSEGCLTRQQILADIRKNWASEETSAAHRIPYPGREHRRPDDPVHDKPERRTRGRGRGRPTAALQTNTNLPTHRPTGGSRLVVRDMRQIDPSFTSTPAIWVREDAMVVSLESIRAIILHNKMLIFDPDNPTVQNTIWHVKKRLTNNIEDAFLPFEFRALEGILVYACSVLEKDFVEIEPELRRTLGDLPSHITPEQLEKLRQLEQRLNQYYSRVRKVQQALQALLDEDEDMADMYLTEKRKNPNIIRNPIDHDEAEVLLETYLQSVDVLTTKAGLLNRAIDDTENLIEIHLDSMQNKLLLVDLTITICNSVLSFLTMATGIFGMNFPLPRPMSTLPASKFFFLGSVLTMIFIILFGLAILVQWCRRQGIYSRRIAKKRRRSKSITAKKPREKARRQVQTALAKASKTEGERFSWAQSDVAAKV